jgi:hypothetical protein
MLDGPLEDEVNDLTDEEPDSDDDTAMGWDEMLDWPLEDEEDDGDTE